MLRNILVACLLVVTVPAHAGLFEVLEEVDYAPQSALIAHGAVQIGTFVYLPAMTGKLRPYELGTGSFAQDILLTRNVADFVRESLLKESRFVGLHIDNGPVLSGDIREFSISGADIVTLTIRYTLKDAQGETLYDTEKTTKQPLGAGNVSRFDNSITSNFETLLRDGDFLRVTKAKLNAENLATDAAPSAVVSPLRYAPSSAFIAGGAVAIGTFGYEPTSTGKVDTNQVRNTALGNIHLDQSVAAYFAEAMLKEFRLIGVKVESPDRLVSGTIVNLFCDDLGSSATWTLDVKYLVKDESGNIIYEGEKATKLVTQKMLEFFNDLLRRNFEALLLDDAFLRAIGSSVRSDNVEEIVVPSDGWNWIERSAYGPRSALVAHGAVSVGSFANQVATEKMKPTAIPTTGLAQTVNADKPIAEIMHNLTLNELRFTGVDVTNSDRILTGEIQKYKVNKFSHPEEWMIAVHFVVRNKAGSTLYDALKSATPTNDPMTYNFLEMKVVIEALISDPEFIKAIN